MSVSAYNSHSRAQAVEAVQRAMIALREHWDCVAISVTSTDAMGCTAHYELEHDSNEDEDDDENETAAAG